MYPSSVPTPGPQGFRCKDGKKKVMPLTRPALILGNSACAYQIAKGLAASGQPVIWASADTGGVLLPEALKASRNIETLAGATLMACHGSVGQFEVTLNTEHGVHRCQVSGIVIAENNRRQPNAEAYGLKLTDTVWSLSPLSATLKDEAGRQRFTSKTVVFLTGLATESQPVIAGEAMRACLLLQEHAARTYLLTGNLKVAGEGLEALFRNTREAGTVFVKFSEKLPEIKQEPGKPLQVLFTDEVTREPFRITPDLLVVDETIRPGAPLADIATRLGLHTDSDGYLQTGNVHRIPVFTNRPGVLVAGGARMPQDPESDRIDTENVISQLLAFSAEAPADPKTRAQIQTGRCIRCLTCYRLCPYRAVMLGNRLAVDPQACQRCGICAAECPRGAIQVPELTQPAIAGQIADLKNTGVLDREQPFIVAFCCSRSASLARDMALDQGRSLPEGLAVVEVACGGGISTPHLLAAFQNGADGVAVLTCHPGNCHSEHGNTYAHRRIEPLHEWLPGIGLDRHRLMTATLASNMGSAFAQILTDFAARIQQLKNTSRNG
jgi:quinone-modifying oxidoreductase subunit QmoB